MTKVKETGAAPVSKYAAKKAARVKAALEGNNEETIVNSDVAESANTKIEESTENNNIVNTKKKKNVLPPIVNKFPDHIVQIALLIKNNAEIRRFTALGVLNYLLQKKEISGDSRYVSFKWNKFAVKCNGLMREYSYTEPFFLNALVAAFSSFSASAQRTIDNFCKKEMSVGIAKAVDQEEVDNIATLNEQYQGNVDGIDE